MTDASPFSLKPKDALAYFRQKGMRPAFSYLDVWTEEHSKAFTVAKVLNVGLLQDYRDELDKQLEDGMNFEAFRKAMLVHLKEHGMDGPVEVTDPETGKTATVNLSSTRRLRTVFTTNMRQAYNQGNWQRAWATKHILPYLVYHHNDVTYPRPEHVAWDLICLPIEHPFWKTHYPQCAWGCKCSTESVSRAIMDAQGLKITADKDIPVFPMKDFVNKRTGEVTQVEEGIDPAFNYNVGTAPLRALTPRPAPAISGAIFPRRDDRQAAIAEFLDATGASDGPRQMKDSDHWPLVVGHDLFMTSDGRELVPRPDLLSDLGLVGRALMKAPGGEWVWSDADDLAQIRAGHEIDKTVKAALTNAGSNLQTKLFRLPAWLVEVAEGRGFNIKDFDHAMESSAVRHTLDKHGNPVTEKEMGQIAVMVADFRKILAVVNKPDIVVTGLQHPGGNPVFAFIATVDDQIIAYQAEIRRKKWELMSLNMRKYPTTNDADTIANTLIHNVRNDSGADPKINDMRGKIKPARGTMVRRYKVRLDNRDITIDFGDGTWTYDVQPVNGSK